MKEKTYRGLTALRKLLGQTQTEFAATVGVSKDAVASWDCGRNDLSATMARRIALATGVDDRSLLRGDRPLLTMSLPRRPYTREDFAAHQREFRGGNTEANARRHAHRCGDAVQLLLVAAARREGAVVLNGVMGSFLQWCNEARGYFELEEEIDALLAQREGKFEMTRTYGQWREMKKTDPKLAKQMGFKDEPKKEDGETLTLSMNRVPVWAPGWEMRGKRS